MVRVQLSCAGLNPGAFDSSNLNLLERKSGTLFRSLAGRHGGALRQRKLEQEFLAVCVHGCLIVPFSVASFAAISSNEGARKTCSGPLPSPMRNIRESGEKAR